MVLNTIVYGIKHNNEHIRAASRSGGFFTAVTDVVLKDGGVVYGCVLNASFLAEHRRAETAAERDLFRGSKYIQSNIGNSYKNVKKDFEGIFKEIKNNFPDREIKLGIGDMVEDICSIKKSYVGSLKAVDIGSYIYTDGEMITFEDLGPFGLLRLESIQRKDFGNNFSHISPLLEEPDSDELISTLKVYLESESNCNIAAKKLFIHSNTVRYRIGKIQQICNIDLEDPIERLKVEITLKFINSLK